YGDASFLAVALERLVQVVGVVALAAPVAEDQRVRGQAHALTPQELAQRGGQDLQAAARVLGLAVLDDDYRRIGVQIAHAQAEDLARAHAHDELNEQAQSSAV